MYTINRVKKTVITVTGRDAGTEGQEGQLPPLPFVGRGKGVKVLFKYKEYYITVSFQGALVSDNKPAVTLSIEEI